MGRFEQAGKLLTHALRRAKIVQQVEAAAVLATVAEWLEETWGETGKTQAHPLRVERGVVTIRVANASFASELRLCAQNILRRIEERHGGNQVTELRVEL